MTANGHLILTVDYELFGNGTGCLQCCVVDPCERILSTAERHGTPVTLFVEALELAAIERSPRTLAEARAVERVARQLRGALERGHDVQLHLHPQWLDARHGPGGEWELDLNRWRIGDLGPDDVERAVSGGRSWLERTARTVRPDYTPRVFRAGAWCLQPARAVLSALLRHGIRMDSTVAPGLANPARLDWYDFTQAPPLPWWRADDSLQASPGGGLVEVPIAVSPVPPLEHLRSSLARRLRRRGALAPGCDGSYARRSFAERLRVSAARLAGPGRRMLDVSTCDAGSLRQITTRWLAQHAGGGRSDVPVVAVGHTKNFTPRSEAALDGWLRWALESGLVPSTFGSWSAAAVSAAPAP